MLVPRIGLLNICFYEFGSIMTEILYGDDLSGQLNDCHVRDHLDLGILGIQDVGANL